MARTPNHDTFLKDELRPPKNGMGYWDGFRFGFGFFIAWLLGLLLLGSATYLLALALHIHS